MLSLRRYLLVLSLLLSSGICAANNRNGRVDSINAAAKDPGKICEVKIGDVDYHKFGKLVIEQRDNKYYMTFPFFLYIDSSWYSKQKEDEVIPKGTMITLKLDNGATVQAQTAQDINFFQYFLWRYNRVYASHRNIYESEAGTSATVFAWHNKSDQPREEDLAPLDMYYKVFGLTWRVTFEFSQADMLLMSKHKIVTASSMKNTKQIFLPINHKQSKKVEKSIAALLR